MADATLWATLVPLIPVVVGGLIGLVGGWLGPSLLEQRKEQVEKKKRRVEKFEELVTALYEHKHWLDLSEQVWVYGLEEKWPMTPFARVFAISRAHFPEFESKITALESASIDYEKWMYRATEKRASAGGVRSIEGLPEAYGPYLEKFRSLLNELGELAKREFQ